MKLAVAVLFAVSVASAATISQEFEGNIGFAGLGLGGILFKDIAPFDTSLGLFQGARIQTLIEGDVIIDVSCAGLPLAYCEQDTIQWGVNFHTELNSQGGGVSISPNFLMEFDETVTFRKVYPDLDNPNVADFQSRMHVFSHRLALFEWHNTAPFLASPDPLFFALTPRSTYTRSPDFQNETAGFEGSLLLTVNYDYIPADAVPEPSTIVLAGTALIALAAISRYRKQRS